MASTRRKPFLRTRALVAVAVVSVIAGVAGMYREIGFLGRYVDTEAEIVAVESLGSEEGFPLYRPILRFSPTPGETVERPAAETYRPSKVGERLTVGYDPTNIDDVRLMDIRDRWLTPAWLLVFAAVTLAFAFYRQRRPAEGAGEQA